MKIINYFKDNKGNEVYEITGSSCLIYEDGDDIYDIQDQLYKQILFYKNNIIKSQEFSSEYFENKGLLIQFSGSNNIVIIDKDNKIKKSKICAKNDSSFYIGKSKYQISNLNIGSVSSTDINVIILDDLSCVSFTLKIEDHTRIFIGSDCQVSLKVYCWTGDGHAIFDDLGNCINVGKEVIIGNHVWLGFKSTILKNSLIASNSIVGACSLVSGKFNKQGVALAGVPAKIVRSNISWDRNPPKKYRSQK